MSTLTPTAAAEEEAQPAPAPPAPAPAPDAPLLEISTLTERRTIKIDDRFYDLRNHAEFGIVETQTLLVRRRQCAVLVDMENLTEDDASRASAALEAIINMLVFELPADVLAKLSDFQRAAIVESWYQAGTTAAGATGDGGQADPTKPPTTQES